MVDISAAVDRYMRHVVVKYQRRPMNVVKDTPWIQAIVQLELGGLWLPVVGLDYPEDRGGRMPPIRLTCESRPYLFWDRDGKYAASYRESVYWADSHEACCGPKEVVDLVCEHGSAR